MGDHCDEKKELKRISSSIDETVLARLFGDMDLQIGRMVVERTVDNTLLYLDRINDLMRQKPMSIRELLLQMKKNGDKVTPRALVDAAEQENELASNQRKAGEAVLSFLIKMQQAQVELKKIEAQSNRRGPVINNVFLQRAEQIANKLDKECPPELQEQLLAGAAADIEGDGYPGEGGAEVATP